MAGYNERDEMVEWRVRVREYEHKKLYNDSVIDPGIVLSPQPHAEMSDDQHHYSVKYTSFCMQNPTACVLQDLMISLSASGISLLFYGVYIALFTMCMFITLQRRRARYGLHCLLMSSLMILTTASLVVNMIDVIISNTAARSIVNLPYEVPRTEYLGSGTMVPITFDGAQIGLYDTYNRDYDPLVYNPILESIVQIIIVTSNSLTNVTLLWRCHLIWGSRWRVTIPITLLCIGTNAVGYLTLLHFGEPNTLAISRGRTSGKLRHQSILLICFWVGSLCCNLMLTLLIAERVFRLGHQIAKYTKRPVGRLYRTITLASLESGFVYPLVLLLYTTLMLLGYDLTRSGSQTSSARELTLQWSLSFTASVLYSLLCPIMVRF
ncbi:hypothetical protein PM082_018590 [Marasmius tenuissimus]|nr:hypothetical protein PM082_018590 [Marasmius tenuissimus]